MATKGDVAEVGAEVQAVRIVALFLLLRSG